MKKFDFQHAMALSQRAQERAHAPYSGYQAGVTLYAADGGYYTGCAVEYADYLGYEAATAALGRLVAESGWVEKRAKPQVAKAVFCVPEIDPASQRHLPEATGRGHLAFFAAPGAEFLFAAPGGREPGDHRKMEDILPCAHYQDFTPAEIGLRQKALAEIDESDPALRRLHHVRWQAYNPYSRYCVGAMVRTTDGQVFYGCNFETGRNTGLHAEGMAIAAMVATLGSRARISEVTVLTHESGAFPCGDCRQKINEFATPETEIVSLGVKGDRRSALQRDILPGSFNAADLREAAGDKG